MKRFCDFVVDKKKIFIVVFVLLAIVGGVTFSFVKVNYDMSKYLPEDSETYDAMQTMYREFGDNGTLSVMASDVTYAGAYGVKKKIEAIDGIESVIWLDTALLEFRAAIAPDMSDEAFITMVLIALSADPSLVPEEFASTLETFFKDGKALYQVTFTGSSYDAETVAAIDGIKALGHEFRLSGMAASSYAMQKCIQSELTLMLAVLAPLLLILLFSATSSFFEPIIYVAVIGVSVLLNMGSNIILGSVSYLTNSIAAIIQVAVSMDYAIFLLHSYKKIRARGSDAADSAKQALRGSLSPISASSLTTIAGFVALTFMKYKFGLDIGLVLTKGIVCSLITCFLFMPGFLVLTDKLLMNGSHRTVIDVLKGVRKHPGFHSAKEERKHEEKSAEKTRKEGLSRKILGLRFIVPLLFIAFLLPSYLTQRSNMFLYGELASSGGEGSELLLDRAAVEETFGSQNNLVVMLEREHWDRETELAAKLGALDCVSAVQSYSVIAEMMGEVPAFMAETFRSENYSLVILTVDTDEESEEAFAAVNEIKAAVRETLDGGYKIVGNTPSTMELKEINQKDYTLTTTLALIFIFVILLLNKRGLVLPVIMAAVIQGSIWINMAIPAIAGIPLVYLGYLIVSCFQMGCTIDYGILFSSNYSECRKTMNKFDAVRAAYSLSFGAISLSAAILILVGFTVGVVGSIPSTSNIGLLLGLGTFVSYVTMTFVLPLFLVLMDKPISVTTLKPLKTPRSRPRD